MKQKKNRDIIKIRYSVLEKTKNKVLSCKDLNYAQFAEKVTNNLELQKDKYFRIYYTDENSDQIIINTPEDYDIFVQNAEAMILCIQETKEKQMDFRKPLKKLISQIKIQQWREEVFSKQEQASELQKKQQVKNFKVVIQKNRNKMIKQLEQFKQKLQNDTKQKILNRLKQIQNDQRLRQGTFEHKVRCQNEKCKKKNKNIIGLRSNCLQCHADFCSNCSQQEFKFNQQTHKPIHPMLKVRNGHWEQMEKKILQQFNEDARIKNLAQFMNWDFQRARKFVRNHPSMNQDQLIDKALKE